MTIERLGKDNILTKPDVPSRQLDINIAGGSGQGKTTVLWLILQALETFGANVNVTGVDGGYAHVQRLRELPHNLKPGNLNGMTVTINTELRGHDE